MDDIIVIDDFLTKEELVYIQDKKSYKNHYWTIQNSGNMKQDDVCDFNTNFLQKDLMDNEYYTSYLFNKIKKFFNQDYKLNDVYLNGHEALRNGSFHIDDDADRTVILYISPWEPAFGGFTHFIKSKKEHIIVPPIEGRLVNFRADIIHKAYAYCHQQFPMRITAAFKLKL
tara:strand:- start:51 stop:563 length:513 start_codon:yes stop_codon:yes gene_type:complete